MAFRGWPAEVLDFFEGLEEENTKAYWERNKSVYEQAVRGPMEQLLAELEPEWGTGRIFRPYRDIRFSADKSPYKTNIAAMVGDGYIHLNANGLGAGSGMYHMAPDQLERFREAVSDERSGREIAGIVEKAREGGYEVTAHEVLKTAPKGYPKDHPRIELLRHKGLITWKEWEPGPWLGTKRAKDRIVSFLQDSKPLNRWLGKHVGPSTFPEQSR